MHTLVCVYFGCSAIMYENRPGHYVEALALMTHMQLHDGLKPTTTTYNLVMTACDNAANYAKVILSLIQ
jgi:hypothetical protein